jgi:hypothetical protein
MRIYPTDPRKRTAMTNFMLLRISELAVQQGLPLTSSERYRLAAQTLPSTVDHQFQKRVMALISDVMRREPPPKAGKLDSNFRLADALKHIGGKKDWPYIAHLVEVVRKSGLPQPSRWTPWQWFKDKSVLLAYVLLLMLGLVAIGAILGLLGALR